MGKIIDRRGQRFGRLVVIDDAEPFVAASGRVAMAWMCQCDCGSVFKLRSGSLTSGNTRSCGCLRKELVGTWSRTHGMRWTAEYRIWLGIRNRCNNPRCPNFADYGGRGIKICPEWDSFLAFFSDMGPRPSDRHSVDRIDNNKGYEPSNCRWATQTQQSRNMRRNRYVLYLGQRVCMAEAAELSGIPRDTLKRRVYLGWEGDRLFSPVKRA